MRRLAPVIALLCLVTGISAPASAAAPLANLAHLDALTTRVSPPAVAGHSTYRQDSDPRLGALWVYADRLADGGYKPTGGGTYDAATNTYGQGAYDADDISRAAVVYLRHWRAGGDGHSREQAYALLRGLTYLQTTTGPHAGDVVLWMQPDGTLNPSALPKEDPDPSDSGPSYWLARTVWALGEGYAAFRHSDPGFASFLRERLDLAIKALDRDVLAHYGSFQTVHGVKVPSWLIADGADATSEAVLGLSAYVVAGGPPAARTALDRFATGIAAMSAGNPGNWPYGAILPWALSRSDWHAWGTQMPSALARATPPLGRPRLLGAAVADAAVFTPHLLTATGPDNGLLPTPIDGSQIAYGADARFEGLLAVASAARSDGLRRLAGVAAGWFFGQNPAGAAMYDPATGVTFDGVSADGVVNRNSGAESTVHGLLTMEALDAAPDLAALARASAHVVRRDGQRTVEAESATLTGGAHVVRPDSPWTGDSQWSGGAYVTGGGRLAWTLPASPQPRLVEPVAYLLPGARDRAEFRSGNALLGRVRFGATGPQGVAPAPGALLPVALPGSLPPGAVTLTADGSGDLDAVELTPLVSSLVTGGTALLSSVARTPRTVTVTVPGDGRLRAATYDTEGRTKEARTTAGRTVTVTVPPGGFALITP
ncbi:hypothetical protein [Actinomadura sp. DC4]|uniref:hypothetical protein n=1 Tax=Actinomadura sp. DC4 TaxID=3055069 RepID=UPI0025B14ADC|nr:hypothetical protein [Actinomadura sp. DC4]MDN3351581.1 hypothetical protein [Actinomadura sp. DC4]